jgi:hypothetical protein
LIFASVFAIFVGLGMIVQWTVSYVAGQIPELETEPIRIGFHVAAEMVTALALIVSGIGSLYGAPWTRTLYPLSIGMLLYTSVASPGYFAQRGKPAWVFLFGALVLLALVSITLFSARVN